MFFLHKNTYTVITFLKIKNKQPNHKKPWGPRQHINSHMFTSSFVEELKHYLRKRLVPIQPSLTDHMNILIPSLLTILKLLQIHSIMKSYFYSDGSHKTSANLNVFYAIQTLAFFHQHLCRLLLLMGHTITTVKQHSGNLLCRTQKVSRYHSNLVLVSPLKPF